MTQRDVLPCTLTYVGEMTVSEARAALPEVLDRVDAGEEITITRHGVPAAVVLRPDALRVRRAEAAFDDADRIAALLDAGRRGPLRAGGGLRADRAEALVVAVREDRERS